MISLDFSSHAPLIHVHTDYSKVSVYFENEEGLDLKPLTHSVHSVAFPLLMLLHVVHAG